MQLNGDRSAAGRPMVTDWEVTAPNGRSIVVPKVHHAYVDEKTGTLHFSGASGETIDAFGRGFWVRVRPTS